MYADVAACSVCMCAFFIFPAVRAFDIHIDRQEEQFESILNIFYTTR